VSARAGGPAAGTDEPPKPARLYLDTSAYLCILLAEAGSERLSRETAGSELLSSVLLVLEAKRNLIRLTREGVLTPEQYAACMARIDEDVERFVFGDLTLDRCRSTLLAADRHAAIAGPGPPAHGALVPCRSSDRSVRHDGRVSGTGRQGSRPARAPRVERACARSRCADEV
jgi:hypothetical protein